MNVLINVVDIMLHISYTTLILKSKNNAVILYAPSQTVKTEYENTKASNKREK